MVSRSRTGGSSSRLGRRFFDRPTARVARELLGVLLSVGPARDPRVVRIVETEAYVGRDPANHAFRGPTRRNRSMFGRPGTLYVYRIHQVVCANLVTRPGEAVLLRAGEPLTPGLVGPSGPGRLCRSLGIALDDDGTDVVRGGRVSLARRRPGERDRGGRGAVVAGPRIGIRRAADRPLRFALAGNPWVSRPRPPGWAGITAASPRSSRGGGASSRTRTTRIRPSGGGRSGDRTVGR